MGCGSADRFMETTHEAQRVINQATETRFTVGMILYSNL